MILNEMFSSFIKGEPVKEYPREQFRSEETYNIYLQLRKLNSYKKTIRKIKHYLVKQYPDVCFVDDLLRLQVNMIALQKDIIDFFEGKCKSTTGEIFKDIYTSTIQFPTVIKDPFDTLSQYSVVHLYDDTAPKPITYDDIEKAHE